MRDQSRIVDFGVRRGKGHFDMLVLKLDYGVMVPWQKNTSDLTGAKYDHVPAHLMSS